MNGLITRNVHGMSMRLLNMKIYIAPLQRQLLRIAPDHSTAAKEITWA